MWGWGHRCLVTLASSSRTRPGGSPLRVPERDLAQVSWHGCFPSREPPYFPARSLPKPQPQAVLMKRPLESLPGWVIESGPGELLAQHRAGSEMGEGGQGAAWAWSQGREARQLPAPVGQPPGATLAAVWGSVSELGRFQPEGA